LAKLQRSLSLFFYFAVCWLFTLLVLVHFSALRWRVFVPLLVAALIQALFAGFLMRVKKLTLNYVVTVSALVGLIAFFLLDQAFFPACIIACLWGYFTLTGLQRGNSNHLWLLVVLSAALGTLYDLYLTIPEPGFIVWTLAAELACLCGYLLTAAAVHSRWLPAVAGLFLAAAAVLSLIVSVIKPVLVWIYDMIFIVFVKNVMYAFANGYWALISRLANRKKSGLIRQALQDAQTEQNRSHPRTAGISHGVPDTHLIGLLAAFAAVTIVLIFVWLRWRHQKLHLSAADASQSAVKVIGSSSDTPAEDRVSFRPLRRFFSPRDPVRRTVFMLQKQAEKSGNSRHSGETLTDWMTRLGLQEPALVRGYQKVRYGHDTLTAEEWAQFRAAAETTDRQLKARAKIKRHTDERE
jgi:hypothetical protein